MNVDDALKEIPATYREAVRLRDVERKSYEEIAFVLGIKVGTVRSRINRGRAKLRKMLDRNPYDEKTYHDFS